MPSFSESVDIDIDAFEYLRECSKDDIDDVIAYLVKKKHIPSQSDKDISIPEQLFEEALNKIHGKWNRLTAEEEQMIYRISNKF